VNEGRDLGAIDRFKFYDHTNICTAMPPDVFRVDEKHLREHYVFKVLGLIITTNHRHDAWASCSEAGARALMALLAPKCTRMDL
jgi:hypothetical protein